MSSTLGILLGALVSDLNRLFASIKGLGIVLYAPALVYMFPDIPQWIGRTFPTYYIVQPVIENVKKGTGWGDVLPDMGIILDYISLMIVALAIVSWHQPQKAVA